MDCTGCRTKSLIENHYYCYVGDVKKLIPNGWTFQKLYARNYKTYRKNGIIMYVVSKMCLEIDNIKGKYHKTLIEFILEHLNEPESFWVEPSTFFPGTMLPAWVIQKGEIMTKRQSIINKRDWHLAWEKNNNIQYLEDGEPIRLKWIQTIKELVELGGVELKKF